MLHITIIVIVVAIVLVFQLISFLNSIGKLNNYRNIFPDSQDAFCLKEIENMEEDCQEPLVRQIAVNTSSETLNKIMMALNRYLVKNNGAASDFHLMKDVVERYCDAEEEEICTQQQLPLYLGLIGTVAGIIIGIGSIVISGDFNGSDLMFHIKDLMICVAIAMVASLVGVMSTAILSWKIKSAIFKVQEDKNVFYSWIQTELLPTLSENAASAIYMLQQNLARFNQTFVTNIGKLDKALSQVSSSTVDQIQLLEEVRQLKVTKFASANVAILQNLQSCLVEMKGFTDEVEVFKKYLSEVYKRESHIKDVVAHADDSIKSALDSLADSSSQAIAAFKERVVMQFDKLPEIMSSQQELFKKTMEEQRKEFSNVVEDQNQKLLDMSSNFATVLKQKSDDLYAVSHQVASIISIKESIEALTAQINQAIEVAVSHNRNEVNSGTIWPWYIKVMCIIVVIGVVIVLLRIIQLW